MSDGWERTARGWRKVYSERPAAPGKGNPDLACPRVISDTMDPVEHVDGRYYDSKSAFRAVTKARGYEEVGNDPARHRPPEKPKRDSSALDAALHKAIAQVTT